MIFGGIGDGVVDSPAPLIFRKEEISDDRRTDKILEAQACYYEQVKQRRK